MICENLRSMQDMEHTVDYPYQNISRIEGESVPRYERCLLYDNAGVNVSRVEAFVNQSGTLA